MTGDGRRWTSISKYCITFHIDAVVLWFASFLKCLSVVFPGDVMDLMLCANRSVWVGGVTMHAVECCGVILVES